MIVSNPKYKKHCEKIIEYCKFHGMDPVATMGLWNHLIRVYNRIESIERQRQNLQPATTGSKVTGHKAPLPKPPRK